MKRAFVAASVALVGCGITHLDTNAPGIANIRERPADPLPSPYSYPAPRPHAAEPPEDPGGHMIVASYGGFAGVGGAGGPGDPAKVSYVAGAEVSIAKGTTRHARPDAFFWPTMESAFGANLGFTAARPLGRTVGPLYAEAELRRDLFSLAAGWVWNPLDKTHGPQVTFGAGPMFVRFTHELDLGTQLHVGFWLKGYSAWAWSR